MSSDNPQQKMTEQATAYVFGELSDADTISFEKELKSSPELQAEVDSIREVVKAIEIEFDQESVGVSDTGREQIELAMAGQYTPSELVGDTNDSKRWLVGLAVAASVLIVGGMAVVPNMFDRRTALQVETERSAPMEAAMAEVDDLSRLAVDKVQDSEIQDGLSSDLAEADSMSGMQIAAVEVPSSPEGQRDLRLNYKSQTPADADAAQLEARGLPKQGQVGQSRQGSRPANQMQPESRPVLEAPAARPDAIAVPAPQSARQLAVQPRSAQVATAGDGAMGGDAMGGGSAANSKAAQRNDQLGDVEVQFIPELGQVTISGKKPDVEKLQRTLEEVKRKSRSRRSRGSELGMEMSGGMDMGMDDMEMGMDMDMMDMGMGMDMKGAANEGAKRKFNKSHDFGLARGPTKPFAPGGKQPSRLSVANESVRGKAIKKKPEAKRLEQLQKQLMDEQRAVDSFGAAPVRFQEEAELRESLLLQEQLVEREAGDRFAAINDNPFRSVTSAPLSTFSIDVDTASYSKVRMYLMQHRRLPQPDAIRIEELINYFDYSYEPPANDKHPFSAAMQVATCPWNPKHKLARVGIKGKEIQQQRPPSNLVFLLDVSGSMNNANKLPLVIDGMKKLVDNLTENDSIAIVVYASASGMVLDSTTGDKKKTILDALDRLKAGGSTAGAQGIRLAYQVAHDNFITGGTNRVILCTDGDFNVGVSNTDALVKLAADNAKSNVFLSVLGYGSGNHNDEMMEKVSNAANGNYAFIDTASESQKVLVDQMEGTLVTIAKDVKIQIEFNPAKVDQYRLIGYENRVMAAEDFANDKKDAGEIGAGHTVTALYEIIPANVVGTHTVDTPELRYKRKKLELKDSDLVDELLTLKLRYKQPTGTKSTLVEFPIKDNELTFSQADQDFQFAASVASFGMLLRNSPHKGDANFDSVEELATAGAHGDKVGYRTEFVEMVKRAKELAK